MGKYGFTLRFLLGLTALMCGVLALLRYPTPFNLVATFSLTLVAIVAAMIAAATAHGTLKAFCLGFAIVGGIHLILVFTDWFETATNKVLLSNYCLDQLAPSFGYQRAAEFDYEERTPNPGLADWPPDSAPARYFTYIVIGQSLITLILAAVGGWLGTYLHGIRNDGKPKDQPDASPRQSSSGMVNHG